MKAIACKFKVLEDSAWEFGIAIQTADDVGIMSTASIVLNKVP
jgi:hypothetical protein